MSVRLSEFISDVRGPKLTTARSSHATVAPISASSSRRMCRILLIACLCALCVSTGCAVLQCTVEAQTIPNNIDGELLVLDAGSISYKGPHPAGPAIADATQCAAACSQLPSCNAWTFCGNAQGCGSGCRAWIAKHPKLPTKGIISPDPTDVDLPVRGFGPWTFPQTENGCQYSFDTDSTSDAWPYGLCSLKRVVDPKKPKFYKTRAVITESANKAASAEGWISGTYDVSGDCQGLSASVCRQCGQSKNPDKCLKCAKDPRAQFSKKPINYLIKQGNKAQNACAVCSGLADAALQARCFECILDARACSTCVYGAQMWGYGKPNIGACLACSFKKGDTYAGACNACAQSKQPGRCFSCLDTMPLKICGVNETIGTSGCQIGANDQTPCDKCSNAAMSDTVFRQCMSCYNNPHWANECSDCGSTPTTADSQSRCYQCISAARFPSYEYYGCASCFSSLGSQQACLRCVEDAGVPYAAKASCSGCFVTKSVTACLSCLKTQQQDYSAACG